MLPSSSSGFSPALVLLIRSQTKLRVRHTLLNLLQHLVTEFAQGFTDVFHLLLDDLCNNEKSEINFIL